MATQKALMCMILVVVVLSMLCRGGVAQSDCTNVLISMSPCLSYITGNSSNPSSQCCSQLANVVRASPQCLCQVLNGGGSSLGVNVNQTQALALPGACKVTTPSASNCNPASPSDSPPVAKGGSKTSNQGAGSSNGSIIKLPLSMLVFVLLASSYASLFAT